MAANVGVNITCNSSCFQWCPRTLKIACCCCEVSDSESEDDKSETDDKVQRTKSIVFESIESKTAETEQQQAVAEQSKKKKKAPHAHTQTV